MAANLAVVYATVYVQSELVSGRILPAVIIGEGTDWLSWFESR